MFIYCSNVIAFDSMPICVLVHKIYECNKFQEIQINENNRILYLKPKTTLFKVVLYC